jgi:hypothetical protein
MKRERLRGEKVSFSFNIQEISSWAFSLTLTLSQHGRGD